MKKFRISSLMYVVAVSALLFSACDKKDADELSVLPKSLTFAAVNSTAQDITVETNVKDWDFSKSDNWITVSKGEGKLTVTVSEFSGTSEDRTGNIVVRAGKLEETVSITQTKQPINTLSINPTSLIFYEDETGMKPVTVTTNAASWNFTGGAAWLSLDKSGNQLRVAVDELNFDKERTATITITAGNAPSVTLQVKQEVS